jgi:hypothetical protein
MIHVRYEGRSYDFDERSLELNGLYRLGDHEIKQRLAEYFDVSPDRLDGYIVDRMPNGDYIVRPEAVYG